MATWIQRVSGLLGGSAIAIPAAAAAPAHPGTRSNGARPPTAAAQIEAPIDAQVLLFEWLLGCGAAIEMPLTSAEHRLLAQLDEVLASDSARNGLLPRAPAVIPQLLACLRDPGQSSDALASRVAKDAQLVAEVIRLANGVLARAAEPVTDLSQAITRLGTEGLRRAIAKVVLKPIFDAPADSFSGRAAPRLWRHSEIKAAHCMRLAATAGIDPFEGYLAGLMHNIGWSAALRALDACPGGRPARFSAAFVRAFAPRREAFFALLVMPWQLTDALTALATQLLAADAAPSPSPLALALLAADRSATLELVGPVSAASRHPAA